MRFLQSISNVQILWLVAAQRQAILSCCCLQDYERMIPFIAFSQVKGDVLLARPCR